MATDLSDADANLSLDARPLTGFTHITKGHNDDRPPECPLPSFSRCYAGRITPAGGAPYMALAHRRSQRRLRNCWNDQAVKEARDYRSMTAFSRQGLIEQLEYEGFTSAQAVYGVDNA